MQPLIISSPKELKHFTRTLKDNPIRVFVLRGGLGAGKTTLVRAFASLFGMEGQASSPTFALLNVYEGPVLIHHFDLYRLGGPEEAEEWGFSELAGAGDYNFIEWGEKALELIPRPYVLITMEHGEKPGQRLLEMQTIE